MCAGLIKKGGTRFNDFMHQRSKDAKLVFWKQKPDSCADGYVKAQFVVKKEEATTACCS